MDLSVVMKAAARLLRNCWLSARVTGKLLGAVLIDRSLLQSICLPARAHALHRQTYTRTFARTHTHARSHARTHTHPGVLRWGTRSLLIRASSSSYRQYIAMHANLLPGISSLLISTLPVHSPAFFQNLSRLFPVLAVANTGSCVGPQTKKCHPAGCRFPC